MRKNSIVTLLLLVALTVTGFTAAHKFYISTCSVEHNAQNQSLEIIHKVFIDDLEDALEGLGTERLFLGTEREHAETDKYLLRYLESNFKVVVDGTSKTWDYIGKEVQDDAYLIYLEILGVEAVKDIVISNRMLTESFDGQSNMVHVKVKGSTKTLMLNKTEPTGNLSFE